VSAVTCDFLLIETQQISYKHSSRTPNLHFSDSASSAFGFADIHQLVHHHYGNSPGRRTVMYLSFQYISHRNKNHGISRICGPPAFSTSDDFPSRRFPCQMELNESLVCPLFRCSWQPFFAPLRLPIIRFQLLTVPWDISICCTACRLLLLLVYDDIFILSTGSTETFVQFRICL